MALLSHASFFAQNPTLIMSEKCQRILFGFEFKEKSRAKIWKTRYGDKDANKFH